MKKMLIRSYSFASLLVPALLLACGGDSTSPANTATGNYTAISFVTTGAGGQHNEIAAGSTLVLNLNANGTTSGHLHMSSQSTGGAAFDADMAGTWSQTGMTVDINQAADTFVRDMPFELTPDIAGGWNLVGDETFSATRIQITLKRS